MTDATGPAADDEDDAWRESLAAERRWREDVYTGPETPLGSDARKAFGGLAWFPPDPAYRLAGVPLARHAMPRPAALPATGEEAVALLEVGVLRFRLAGRDLALVAFEPAPGEADEAYVLVPFRDATSGKETYGGGRYLDFEPAPDDVHVLDFNRAYHPYCAFDASWTCVLPPPANALPVPVRAGERL